MAIEASSRATRRFAAKLVMPGLVPRLSGSLKMVALLLSDSSQVYSDVELTHFFLRTGEWNFESRRRREFRKVDENSRIRTFVEYSMHG